MRKQGIAKIDRARMALDMRELGLTLKDIGRAFGVSVERARQMVDTGRRIVEGANNRKAKFRAHTARIDATQPDDPPRGVWIEK